MPIYAGSPYKMSIYTSNSVPRIYYALSLPDEIKANRQVSLALFMLSPRLFCEFSIKYKCRSYLEKTCDNSKYFSKTHTF